MKKYLTISILLLFTCAGCSFFNTTAKNYKTEYYATVEMYVETMTAVNQLHAKGHFEPATYDIIISYANSFQGAAKLAKYALDMKDYTAYSTNMLLAKQILGKITNISGVPSEGFK